VLLSTHRIKNRRRACCQSKVFVSKIFNSTPYAMPHNLALVSAISPVCPTLHKTVPDGNDCVPCSTVFRNVEHGTRNTALPYPISALSSACFEDRGGSPTKIREYTNHSRHAGARRAILKQLRRHRMFRGMSLRCRASSRRVVSRRATSRRVARRRATVEKYSFFYSKIVCDVTSHRVASRDVASHRVASRDGFMR